MLNKRMVEPNRVIINIGEPAKTPQPRKPNTEASMPDASLAGADAGGKRGSWWGRRTSTYQRHMQTDQSAAMEAEHAAAEVMLGHPALLQQPDKSNDCQKLGPGKSGQAVQISASCIGQSSGASVVSPIAHSGANASQTQSIMDNYDKEELSLTQEIIPETTTANAANLRVLYASTETMLLSDTKAETTDLNTMEARTASQDYIASPQPSTLLEEPENNFIRDAAFSNEQRDQRNRGIEDTALKGAAQKPLLPVEAVEQAVKLREATEQLAALKENLLALRRCQAAHQLRALIEGAPFIVHAGGKAAPQEVCVWYRSALALKILALFVHCTQQCGTIGS